MMSRLKTNLRDASFFLGEAVVPKTIRYSGMMGSLRRQMIYWARDSFVLSYPKCGRTWLRTMIGHVMDRHYNLNLKNPMEIQHLWKLSSDIPCIGFSHDDSPNLKRASAIQTDKSRYRSKNILLLVRDPRDVVVSYYFDARFRMNIFDGSINEFLAQDVGSIASVVAFYNAWAQARHHVKSFKLLTYEDMHRDPKNSLISALSFLGVENVPEALIDDAIEFGSFENLRKIETADAFGHERMRPADQSNPDSFKVRRGKAGGYVDYFSAEEIAYMDRHIETLDPMFAVYKRSCITA
ncbi:MAG: Sulfotransferase domain protein [Sphingomonadales bacterium]|nr:Sulfotransferase domain protein [Sphingomonadales bacterium]